MIKRAGNVFSTAYLVIMFCVYPFYVENGYINIGEAKNHFFFNMTMAACFVLAVLYVAGLIREAVSKRKNGQTYLMNWESVSGVDLLVLLYATQMFLSYVFSKYKDVALWGEDGWYMGLIPLLLLCAVYFLISRLWQWNEQVLYAIMGASAIVFLLGICNRFSVYPIAFSGSQPGFISTLGNINWFCGFVSIVAPFGVGFFVTEKTGKARMRLAAGGYALLTFTIGFAQGSDSIFLWFGAIFFLLLWMGIENGNYLKRWFVLLILLGISPQIVRALRILTVDKYNYGVDGVCGYFTDSSTSLWITLVGVLGYLLVSRNMACKKCDEETVNACRSRQRGILLGCVALVSVLLFILAIVNTKIGLPYLKEISIFTLDSNWGNGRGDAFGAGVKTFLEAPARQKLFGAGPDCFASAVYELPDVAIALRQRFGTARLTNAHNEMITTLVNTGILGLAMYVGVLVSCIGKFMKKAREKKELYLFALCIFGYIIHNMVSFAQVLNIPFLFIILGMGEAICRNLPKNK